MSKKSSELFRPQMQFVVEEWEKLSSAEKKYFLKLVVKHQEGVFLQGLLNYEKQNGEGLSGNRKLLISIINPVDVDLKGLRFIFDHIFSDDETNFYTTLGREVWNIYGHIKRTGESEKLSQKLWLSLYAEESDQPEIIANRVKNILSLHSDELSYSHPLTWGNNYIVRECITIEDRKRLWSFAIKERDAKIISDILSLYISKQIDGNHPLSWEIRDAAVLILAFDIIASTQVPDNSIKRNSHYQLVKYLWQQIDPKWQQVLWKQSLEPSMITEDETSEVRSARVNRMHSILSCYKDRPTDKDHPYNWAGEKYRSEILENLFRNKNSDKLFTQTLWSESKEHLRHFIWFKAVLRGEYNIVENIIKLYSDKPMDGNHPLNWVNKKEHSTALFVILRSQTLNNQVVKLLLEEGAEPVDANVNLDDVPKEAKNAAKMIKQYAMKYDVESYKTRYEDGGDEEIYPRIHAGLEKFLQLSEEKSVKSEDERREICLDNLYSAYRKIRAYAIEGERLNTMKLVEILEGSAIDERGDISEIDPTKALTKQEKQNLSIVLSGGECVNERNKIITQDALEYIVESLAPNKINNVMIHIYSLKRERPATSLTAMESGPAFLLDRESRAHAS